MKEPTKNIPNLREYAAANRLAYFETTGTERIVYFLGPRAHFGIAVAIDPKNVSETGSVVLDDWRRHLTKRINQKWLEGLIVGLVIGLFFGLLVETVRHLTGY